MGRPGLGVHVPQSFVRHQLQEELYRSRGIHDPGHGVGIVPPVSLAARRRWLHVRVELAISLESKGDSVWERLLAIPCTRASNTPPHPSLPISSGASNAAGR